MELKRAIPTLHLFSTAESQHAIDLHGIQMAQLSIEELHDIIQGELTMSSMPPRGGAWAPLGRIVPDSRQVQRGDVFWGLPGTCCDGSYFAEEAMMRAAQGTVVSGRHIEPWAGCFSIRVDDSRNALRKLGQWSRRRFEGTVIHVHDGDEPDRLWRWTCQALEFQSSGLVPGHCVNSASEAALGMLDWDVDHECAVMETNCTSTSQIDEISHLCCPHILAINCTRKSTHSNEQVELLAEVQRKLCDALPTDGVVVVSGDNTMSSACKGIVGDQLWIGCSPECDLTAKPLSTANGCLAFLCDGVKFEVPACQPGDLHRVLAAIGIARVLGLSTRAVRESLRHPRPKTTERKQVRTLGVSPSVSALREDDATLPPGLERYAC